jgi:purine-nucleoside phosphorylase
VRLAAILGDRPAEWFVVGGSGLGGHLVDALLPEVTARTELYFAELGLPSSSVPGHGTRLVVGELRGRVIVVQTGRLHPYEGHSIDVCTAALAAACRVGVRGVLLTAAVGGLDPAQQVGTIAMVSDHLSFLGPTPLVGPRFVDCSRVYDARLRGRIQAIGDQRGIRVREVVYAHTRGPQYETPAEVHALKVMGASVVGMSTTYEAILAAAHGIPCAAVVLITNVAGAVGLTHDEVQQRADAARDRISGLVVELLSEPAATSRS